MNIREFDYSGQQRKAKHIAIDLIDKEIYNSKTTTSSIEYERINRVMKMCEECSNPTAVRNNIVKELVARARNSARDLIKAKAQYEPPMPKDIYQATKVALDKERASMIRVLRDNSISREEVILILNNRINRL